MQTQQSLSLFTLLLMVSFASVNAVLFTPALPSIATYFAISNGTAQLTITWFLIGYAVGQLIYGPLANRFGRKRALYMGIWLQIISCGICALAGFLHIYAILVVGRLLLALGSGVGLKMTFTMLNECYSPQIVAQKMSSILLAFAITPGLGVALGGALTAHFGWMSCFYASAVYGFIILYFASKLPETSATLDYNALKLSHLIHGYASQLSNTTLIRGALLWGSATCFIYVFAALAPFIAINLLGLNSAQYGLDNLLPPLGMIIGSLISGWYVRRYSIQSAIRTGMMISAAGVGLMFALMFAGYAPLYSLFLPVVVIYTGLCFIVTNAPTIAMQGVHDKAHGSAMMNFINMGFATAVVLVLGHISVTAMLLPIVFITLCALMIGIAYTIPWEKTI